MRKLKPQKQKVVLFLDDSPGFNSHLVSELKSFGIQLVAPKNISEVERLMATEEAGLLLHGAHTSHSQRELCDQIRSAFPTLPVLHISSESCKEEHPVASGPLSLTMPHLRSTKTILHQIRRLVRYGKTFRSESRLKLAFRTQIDLDQCLDSQEPETLLAQFMSFLGQRIKTENILWLVEGDVDYYKNQLWKVKPFNYEESHVKFVNRSMAWEKLKPNEISQIIESVERAGGEQWPASYNPVHLKLKGSKYDTCLLIPIHEPGKLYGHLIFLNPANIAPSGVLFYWLSRLTQAFRHAVAYAEARSLCYIDDVTEFYNQRYLGMALDSEISRCQRTNTAFSVLFIDIDHFKKVNDTQGHLIGSNILKQLSKILKTNIRSVDYGFRYGGDEFILLLSNTEQGEAEKVAERIRSQVQGHVFNVDGLDLKITLSIGVATFPEHAETKEQIIGMADKAMYDGKNKSRNIVFVAS